MIDHVSLGVRELERSATFYDAVLSTLGWTRMVDLDGAVGYGLDPTRRPAFWILDVSKAAGRAAMPGLGVHVAFPAPDRTSVRSFHAAALARGATDNGAPGLRPEYDPDFYGAFVLDPDGFKIEAVCRRAEPGAPDGNEPRY